MANYNNDFSSFPIATGVPTGFTARWVTTNVTHSIVDAAGDDDNRSFRQNRAANGRGLVTIDAVDGDADRANAEVLVRIKTANPTGAQAQAGPAIRCAGAAAAETGYVCYPFENKLRIARYRSGTPDPPLVDSGTLGLADNTWYWVRFRANGTGGTVTLSAKIWAGAIGDEPGTPSTAWTVTHSDSVTPITAAGWCGMFAFGGNIWDTDAIAVGTNGDTASMSGGGSSTNLVVSSGEHGHTASNLTLTTVGATDLVINAATHAHSAGNLVLSVNNAVNVGPLSNNTGTLLVNQTGITVYVYQTTGAHVVTKTAQTTNASGILTLSDPAIIPSTQYRVVIVMASGAEGMDKVTA